MEIINVSGYTIEEKAMIAQKHLLPKQLEEHGLESKDLKLNKAILEAMVEGYTRESGVRGLENKWLRTVRYVAKSIAMEEDYLKQPKLTDLKTILGPRKVTRDLYENNETAGVVIGLAWTAVGGDILLSSLHYQRERSTFYYWKPRKDYERIFHHCNGIYQSQR